MAGLGTQTGAGTGLGKFNPEPRPYQSKTALMNLWDGDRPTRFLSFLVYDDEMGCEEAKLPQCSPSQYVRAVRARYPLNSAGSKKTTNFEDINSPKAIDNFDFEMVDMSASASTGSRLFPAAKTEDQRFLSSAMQEHPQVEALADAFLLWVHVENMLNDEAFERQRHWSTEVDDARTLIECGFMDIGSAMATGRRLSILELNDSLDRLSKAVTKNFTSKIFDERIDYLHSKVHAITIEQL